MPVLKSSKATRRPTPRGVTLATSFGLICGSIAHLSGLADPQTAMSLAVAGFTGAFLVDLGLDMRERPLPTLGAFLALGLVSQMMTTLFA